MTQATTPAERRMGWEFDVLIEKWNPAERPIHCSNCLHCVVSGDGVHVPRVACELGHGAERSFWQVVRSQRPAAFMPAAQCPDFSSMDEGAPDVQADNEKAELTD